MASDRSAHQKLAAPAEPLFINGEEAARRLCMSRRRLAQLVEAEAIRSVKLGGLRLFRPIDLVNFVNDLAGKAGGT